MGARPTRRPLAPAGRPRHTRGMDQGREDYDDGDPKPEEVVPEWMHVPLAFLLISCGVFVIAKVIGAVFSAG
jgi:hypothetical protein